MSDDADKIVHLSLVPKPRQEDCALKLVNLDRKCDHVHAGFLVDEAELSATCRGCGEKLNPIWALARLAEHESLWRRLREAYIDERKALNERRFTKCQHCQRMTRIRTR